MFKRVDFEPGEAGIERYKNHQLNWALEFIRGNVRVFEESEKFGDDESFHLYIEPNLATLRSIDLNPDLKDKKTLRPYYDDAARPGGFFMGPFGNLGVIEETVHMLEPFFVDMLREKGAENRILGTKPQGNSYLLVPTNKDTAPTFKDALMAARDREIFVALKQGKNIPFEEMVGRVFRSLANTLGVNYYIQEEREELPDSGKKIIGLGKKHPQKGPLKAITFTYEGIGGFRFENNGEDEPVGLTRYSYGGHKQFGGGNNYFVTYEGHATPDILQEKVFDWLIDAMMDINPERLQSEYDYEAFIRNRQTAIDNFYGDMMKGSGIRQTSTGITLKLV